MILLNPHLVFLLPKSWLRHWIWKSSDLEGRLFAFVSFFTDALILLACVHLLSAVQRLPGKELFNGYVPVCVADGDFAPIQCDNVSACRKGT